MCEKGVNKYELFQLKILWSLDKSAVENIPFSVDGTLSYGLVRVVCRPWNGRESSKMR